MTQEKTAKRIYTQLQFKEFIEQDLETDSTMSAGRISFEIQSDEHPDSSTAMHFIKHAENIKIWLAHEEAAPKAPKRTIVRAPGSQPAQILKFLYSKNTFERVFSQIVLDMREEHAEALFQGRNRQANWIHVRGVLTLLATAVIHAATSIGKTAARIWKLTP